MFRIQNHEMASMFNLPVGHVCSSAEEAAIKPAWSKHLGERDEARYSEALASAPNFAYIVAKTWEHGGKSLRRGEVVYVKPDADGFGAAMVTRSKSRTAQGFVWTCGPGEIREHAKLAVQARREEETRQRAVAKVLDGETLTGEETRVLAERLNRRAHEKYSNLSEEQKKLCKAHMRSGASFGSAVEAAINGWEVR